MIAKEITIEVATRIGNDMHVNWAEVDVNEFRKGLEVELEHGSHDPETNVTDDDMELTAKIALAHLKEFPDYYSRLAKMEAAAYAFWDAQGVSKPTAH